MSKTMWRVEPWFKEPDPITVVSETAAFATVEEKGWATGKMVRRRMKKDGTLFDSWADARNAMLIKAERDAAAAQSQLDRARNRVAAVKALTEPTP